MKIDRLLAIVILMINRRRISAKELADYFEVNVRTIYRDIDAICMAGIPIVSYQGANGGFCIMENYKLDSHILSFDDLTSIVMALKGIEATLQDAKVKETIDKVTKLINENEQEKFQHRNNRIIFDFSSWSNSEEYRNKLAALNKAIEEHYVIRIEYIDSEANVSNRIIEPTSLLFKGYTWYLYGFCRNKEDFRLFRVSRVRKLEISKELFEPKPMHTEKMNLQSEWVGKSEVVNLVLRFNPKARVKVEDSFELNQIANCEDGKLIVKAVYPEDEWVYSMIMSYGCDVEVIEPKHIRAIIADKAKRIIEIYKDDINMT